MLLYCGVGEDSWESLRLQGDQSSQSKKKKNQSWLFIGRTETKAEAPILWSPDVKNWLLRCWERLKAGGGGDDRGWNGWIASPTQWRWVWASSGSWWWTGKPDMIQSIGWKRVRHNWATELNLPIWILYFYLFFCLLAVSRTYNIILNKSAETGHIVLFQILQESFQLFTVELYTGCRFIISSFYYVDMFPRYPLW